jgi:hypothetical protein
LKSVPKKNFLAAIRLGTGFSVRTAENAAKTQAKEKK